MVGSLVLGFTSDSSGRSGYRVTLLAGGLLLLFLLARSRVVDRWLSRAIRAALTRWSDMDARDYAGLLDLAGGYSIVELQVREGDWIAGRTLAELSLRDEGLAVLGIERGDGTYRGTATGSARIQPGDTIIVYGRVARLCALDDRPAGPDGDAAHAAAAREQETLFAQTDRTS